MHAWAHNLRGWFGKVTSGWNKPNAHVAHMSNSRITDASGFSIWLSGNGATPVAEPAPLDAVGDGALLAAAFAALEPLDAVGNGAAPVAEPAPLDPVGDGATPVAEPAELDAIGDGALLAAAFATLPASRPRRAPSS